MDNPKLQFSLTEIILFTAAIAIWIGFLIQPSGWLGPGLTVVTTVAGLAGCLGQLSYRYVLRARGIAIPVSLLVFAACAFPIYVLAGSSDVAGAAQLLVETLVSPIGEWFSETGFLTRNALIGCYIATIALTPAHLIRPQLPWAIVSALGVASWFMTGMLLTIGRNFGG